MDDSGVSPHSFALWPLLRHVAHTGLKSRGKHTIPCSMIGICAPAFSASYLFGPGACPEKGVDVRVGAECTGGPMGLWKYTSAHWWALWFVSWHRKQRTPELSLELSTVEASRLVSTTALRGPALPAVGTPDHIPASLSHHGA